MSAILETLEVWSSSPWFYLAILTVAFLDSVVRVVPSEATVILGGTAAGAGELSIFLVVIAAVVGAFCGDSLAYLLGKRLEGTISKTIFRGPKGEARLAKAEAQIAKRGGLFLVTARFIPGARTALTVACGVTRQPYTKWFVRWDLAAVLIWTSYAGGLGMFYGQRLGHTSAFLYAFGTALGVTAILEVAQRLRRGKS